MTATPAHRSDPPDADIRDAGSAWAMDDGDDGLLLADDIDADPDPDPHCLALPDPTTASAAGRAAAAAAAPAVPADEAQLARWLTQVAARDEQALSALYDATLARVYGLVLRIVRRPAWAEEVVEETYFQVWRQALRFDPERGRALTWLLGMARSRAIDALRREMRHQHDSLDPDDDLPLPDTAAAPVADLIDAARGQALLHDALLALGAQPRQLVALAFFRGLSHEEIAAHTALPLGTVKSQIRRALLSLRQTLGAAGLQALPG